MPGASYKPIPGVLKALRIRKGKSQREVAKFVECGVASWRRWETGQGKMAVRQVKQVARKFRTKPEQLVSGWPVIRGGADQDVEPAPASAPTPIDLLTEEQKAALLCGQLEHLGGIKVGPVHWAFEVKCSGMEPEICAGDYVLCDATAEPRSGDIVLLFRTDGTMRCKIFHPARETNVIVLQKHDKAGEPETVSVDDVVKVLPVVAKYLEHPRHRSRGVKQ